jgi:hypothetical protein
MKQKPEKKHTYDRRLAAVCGLFCPACTLFIGSSEDPKRLEPIARQYGKKAEEIRCEGCRSDVRFLYCKTCKMDRCATEKGVEFCGSCKEYPCEEIRTFQAAMPHRIELWKSQERIREVGADKWFNEMIAHYSCPTCGTINSAYDLKCRSCGHMPSCEYVAQHHDEITDQVKKMKLG